MSFGDGVSTLFPTETRSLRRSSISTDLESGTYSSNNIRKLESSSDIRKINHELNHQNSTPKFYSSTEDPPAYQMESPAPERGAGPLLPTTSAPPQPGPRGLHFNIGYHRYASDQNICLDSGSIAVVIMVFILVAGFVAVYYFSSVQRSPG